MTEFPMPLAPGSFSLDAALDDRTRESCRSAPRTGDEAHPIFAFVAALRGAGTSIETLCSLCGCSIEDGPVLASSEIEYLTPMQVDRTYTIAAEITDRIERPSRRFGQAVHVHVAFRIENAGRDYARVRLHMIMPQRTTDGR